MFAVKKAIKEIQEDAYRSYKECKTCQHRNDKHYMNCIECCPHDELHPLAGGHDG